ncbi:MAG: thymidine kinase [Deltaproteobacteria bacterium]|nr:thymidine kinase [Deltaproteobacteria bacterium]
MAKLYFFYSAMNAGKTTSLLQSAHNYRQRGMTALIYTPERDLRGGAAVVSSRIGLQEPAFPFGESFDLFEDIRARRAAGPVDCVFVDEAQFLTPAQVLQLTMVCDQLNIPALTYGLRTDFRGEPFEGSKYLLAWAEELVEVKTVCRSGRKATMSARMSAEGGREIEGEQVQIGYHYEPLSRHLFNLPACSPIPYPPVKPALAPLPPSGASAPPDEAP